MDKLRKIFNEINNISPIRFAVRAKTINQIDLEKLKSNIYKLLSPDSFSLDEVSINHSKNIYAESKRSIIHSDKKISIYINNTSMVAVFSHSIADGKTAISFCINILSDNCPEYQNNGNIASIAKVFPIKFRGLTGGIHTLNAVILQLLTALINGRTKYSKYHNRKGRFSELNVSTIKLDRSTTQSLLDYSKINSTSISSLLMAAQIKASQKVLFDGEASAIGVCSAVDLRQRCDIKPWYGFLSLCISFITVVVKVNKDEPLTVILDKIKSKLSNKIETGAHFTLYKMFPPKPFISKQVVSFFLNLNEKSSLQSNVGTVDNFYALSTEHIVDIDFFVPPGANQPFSICASSYDGEFSLSIVSFNERFGFEITEEIFEIMLSELNNCTENTVQ